MTAGSPPLVWVNDRLVDPAEAQVSVWDRGFRTGEGVFETMRSYEGVVFRLQAHLNRAAAGAARLGFASPDGEAITKAVEAVVQSNDADEDLAVRLTITPGQISPVSPHPGDATGSPTMVVTAQSLSIPRDLYTAGVSGWPVPWAREVADVKAISYLPALVARRAAQDAGHYEALFTDAQGLVLEGSFSNVFAVHRGTLTTPPANATILDGVTRAAVLELADAVGAEVQESPLRATDLAAADEAFLTASTQEIVPLVRVGSQRIGSGRPGPITERLHEAYRELVRRETHPDAQGPPSD